MISSRPRTIGSGFSRLLALLLVGFLDVLTALMLSPGEQQCRLEHKWSCGATTAGSPQLSLTEQLSCQVASALCPKTRSAINECCVQHDACYEQRRGQAYCDDVFCSCLSCSTPCDGPLCVLKVGQGFCLMVRTFGVFIYNAQRRR